jgi:hypothetical protein
MNAPIRALIWEQFWKNRVVFPALGLLLALGAALTHAQTPDLWWSTQARRGAGIAFFISLLLGFAPFTLVESSQGWRMNSMITRWFVLPVRTSLLVLIPFLAACLFMAGLIWAWSPVLRRLAGGFDSTYFMLALVMGAAATQALAWIVPRRPTQFWPLAGIIFITAILFGLAPQDASPSQWADRRPGMLRALVMPIPLFAALAFHAARRNRCGDWPGELRLAWIWGLLLGKRRYPPQTTSRAAALFWSGTWPVARAFVLSWVALALLVIGSQYVQLLMDRPGVAFDRKVIAALVLQVLPFLGVLWLAAGGLFLGGEPGVAFRTSLTSFRATLPVGPGALATQRITTALLAWLAVWIPLLVLSGWYDPEISGSRRADVSQQMLHLLAYMLAVSAHVLIGALPLFLWGRLEGFSNMLLCAIVSWAAAWLLAGIVWVDSTETAKWTAPLAWLGLKLGICGWALVTSWRAGQITWRYAACLVSGWVGLVALLTFALPVWQSQGMRGLLGMALFIPLARLALCPLALAANRSR